MTSAAAPVVAHPEAGRLHDAVGLRAAMTMAEDELAVAVEEVGGAEWAHLSGKGLDNSEPRFERGKPKGGTFPVP